MRHTYELSAETIKVIKEHVTRVAEEMDVDPSYLHQILGKTHTDPFAKFAFLYAAAVRAGCDVSHWLNKLNAIVAKYKPISLKSHTEEIAEFVSAAGDVPIAVIKSKALEEQLREQQEANREGYEAELALIQAIADNRSNYGGPIDFSARRATRAARNGK